MGTGFHSKFGQLRKRTSRFRSLARPFAQDFYFFSAAIGQTLLDTRIVSELCSVHGYARKTCHKRVNEVYVLLYNAYVREQRRCVVART